MRLAGFEAFEVGDPRAVRERLRALAAAPDVGLVLLSRQAAAADPATVARMRGPEPPLAVVFPPGEKS